MPYNFAQGVAPALQNGLTAVVTLPGVASGSLLVCGCEVSSEGRTIVSVTDDRGNDWFVGANSSSVPNGPGPSATSVYYAPDAAAGDTEITFEFDDVAAEDVSLVAAEYEGVDTVAPFDVDKSENGGSVTSVTATTAATANANELVVAFSLSRYTGRPLTDPTGLTFTERVAAGLGRPSLYDARSTVAGAQAITQACSGGESDLSLIVVAFKEAAAAAAAVGKRAGLVDRLRRILEVGRSHLRII